MRGKKGEWVAIKQFGPCEPEAPSLPSEVDWKKGSEEIRNGAISITLHLAHCTSLERGAAHFPLVTRVLVGPVEEAGRAENDQGRYQSQRS